MFKLKEHRGSREFLSRVYLVSGTSSNFLSIRVRHNQWGISEEIFI